MTSVLGGQETLPQSSDILAGDQRRHRNSWGDREGGGMAATKAEMPGRTQQFQKAGGERVQRWAGVSGAD